MIKININYIHKRIKRLLLEPDKEWSIIFEEYDTAKDILKNFIIPLSVIISAFVLLCSFFHYTVFQAIILGPINFVSVTAGAWLSYLLTREYLTNKFRDADSISFNLVLYSASIYIVFHSIGDAFNNGFFSQLFILAGLIFIRTLYIGIKQIPRIQANQKTNLLIITSLSIICFPVIIKHILMIIFGISAFTV